MTTTCLQTNDLPTGGTELPISVSIWGNLPPIIAFVSSYADKVQGDYEAWYEPIHSMREGGGRGRARERADRPTTSDFPNHILTIERRLLSLVLL